MLRLQYEIFTELNILATAAHPMVFPNPVSMAHMHGVANPLFLVILVVGVKNYNEMD